MEALMKRLAKSLPWWRSQAGEEAHRDDNLVDSAHFLDYYTKFTCIDLPEVAAVRVCFLTVCSHPREIFKKG